MAKVNGEIFPNTTGVIETLESGRIEEIETILGPVFRLPRAGVIRPGIKILKGNCTAQDQKLYEELVKQGLDWDEIDQRLGKDGEGKSKLIPHNVDYFTIRPEDCQNPQNVETIYRLYADGDGKLRSFPVWFATNEWWNIIPHSLRCFGRQQGLRFASFFKGSERWCKFPAPTTDKRKTFGGRLWGERPCDPNTCEEFQSGECKFGGVIQCYIPGTKGIGIWIIPTVSWRSLTSIKSSLETFCMLTMGRIAGLFNLPDKNGLITPQPIFRISKKKETVYPEDSGSVKKRDQWIINLDVDVDLSEVVRWATEQKILTRGYAAVQILNGTRAKEEETGHEHGGNTKTQPVSEKPDQKAQEIQNSQPSNDDTTKPAPATTPTPSVPSKTPAKTDDTATIKTQQADAIRKIAARNGIDRQVVETVIEGMNVIDAAELIKAMQKGDLSMFGVVSNDEIPKEITVEEEF